jgi:GxxExxY protein
MEVHTLLGPGFLEAVYEAALAHELSLRGLPYERQKRLPVRYKDQLVGDYLADLVVAHDIVLELKAVSALRPEHEAQAHHYLAATGLHLAILLNFGSPSLQQKRVVRE